MRSKHGDRWAVLDRWTRIWTMRKLFLSLLSGTMIWSDFSPLPNDGAVEIIFVHLEEDSFSDRC